MFSSTKYVEDVYWEFTLPGTVLEGLTVLGETAGDGWCTFNMHV